MDDDALYSPDIVDFIIRKGSYNESLILNHPGLIATHTVAETYIICFVTVSAFADIANYIATSLRDNIPNVVGLTDQESLEAAGIKQVQQQPYLNLNGRNVLIGFVDTGIDYTKEVFRYEDGTSKIKFIYDQSIAGNPPAGFPLGTEYTNEQINSALSSAEDPYSIVPHKDTAGHGTFLASVAAGRTEGDFSGAAPDSEIIMVKLKKAYPYYLKNYCVPADQENAFESTSVMMGVEYILQKSQELHLPVVICIGLGSNYDSHDGLGPLEEYLYFTCNNPGVCTCISVGNESQAKHHFFQKFSKEKTPINISTKTGENAGDIFIAISNKLCDRISVSVKSPTGEMINRIPAKSGYTLTTSLTLEPSRVSVSYFFPLEGSGEQVTIVKILDATPGIWLITVYGDLIINGSIHAWLPLTGFVSPTVEFLSSDPYTTITYPATDYGSIRCGAYNYLNDSLYPKSSWGPTRIEPNVPDLVAPGYQIGGYYPTGYGTMSGTSVATAITAGACALLMQWGIVEGNDLGFCTPLVRAYLIRGCNRSNLVQYPNNQWGYGSLNLMQTFHYMRQK
ncbi:S8 family peptidase [Aminipila terrae]|uniref:S8 family serine peptidase n=1 Tax=Aminipila terrae TaxID=2697030 RepID=A0A6P1MFB4_9FIRM|nr:S8 family peptidase [Aminipila terrae]QHI71853.1 S8 family serine peptidase [Aminipila terrae]